MSQERYRSAITRFILPKRFLGVIPLYLGVEVALGITIFNKCAGAYGILAIFNGHPLETMQVIAYSWSIFCLIVYSQGLQETHKPTLYTFSQIFVTFSIDTLLTCILTIYFTKDWFSNPENMLKRRGTSNIPTNQHKTHGASEEYEYSATLVITLVALISRLYYNFIFGSFLQELFFRPIYLVDQDDVQQGLRDKSILQKLWTKNKNLCYRISKRILA